MRKIWTSQNVQDRPQQGEVNSLPSETVPNQALSVREILTRFAQGIPPDIQQREVFYSEDNDDLRGIDISEYHDLKNSNRQLIRDLKTVKPEPEKPESEKPEPEKPD